MKTKHDGFAVIELLLVLVVVGLLGFAGWRIYSVRRPLTKTPLVGQAEKPTKVVAVGDIACDPSDKNFAGTDPSSCQSSKTHALLAGIKPQFVLALGDLQYNNGALSAFMASYDKSWGADKPITYPAPGNHEYQTKGAAGYFTYFNNPKQVGDSDKGYYSVNLGSWHVIALNSNCSNVGGCGDGSPQLTWLRQDLAANKQACTLAFWHHPHFTSGRYAEDASATGQSLAFWQELVKSKADLVLNGHDHLYERFDRQTADGQQSAAGIRQFTVGTGGKVLYTETAQQANSQKIIDDQFGVLSLELYSKSYTWQFKSVNGSVLDSGSQTCSI